MERGNLNYKGEHEDLEKTTFIKNIFISILR
jgi:hypothetical protein